MNLQAIGRHSTAEPIVRLRERHSHPDTDAAKLAEIETIARAYQALRRETAQHYWAPKHLPAVLHRPRSVVTARRRSGEAAAHPLGSHLQANAVMDGLDVVRGSWEQAFRRVRSRAARKFSDAERHEIHWLLRWPEHLATILEGGVVVPTGTDGTPIEALADNHHARLDRWLGDALRRARPGQPKLRHRLAFELDTYRASTRAGRFPVWLTIQGLTKGHPLRIPMAGSDTAFLDGTANLRVALETDVKGRRRVVFRRVVKLEVVERSGTEIVGIDKGIRAAITATSSDPEHALEFGTDYAAALRHHSDRSFRRGRSRYWSLARSTTDRQKAARIRRHNLGSVRRERAARRAQAHLRNLTGRAARELVEAFPDAAVFAEEALDFSVKNQPRPVGVNRWLNSWTKRRLSKDIALHVSASGARRELVSAAYTSQTCPRCSWTDRGNRKGEVFRCEHCSYRGRADAVASSNVRSRASDRTITRFTPYRVVKQALLRQHVAITDGWCPSPGCESGRPAVVPAGSAALAAA